MKYITLPIEEIEKQLSELKVLHGSVSANPMDDDYNEKMISKANLWGKIQVLKEIIVNHAVEDTEENFF